MKVTLVRISNHSCNSSDELRWIIHKTLQDHDHLKQSHDKLRHSHEFSHTHINLDTFPEGELPQKQDEEEDIKRNLHNKFASQSELNEKEEEEIEEIALNDEKKVEISSFWRKISHSNQIFPSFQQQEINQRKVDKRGSHDRG